MKYQKELDLACTAVQHVAVLTDKLQKETVGKAGQIEKFDHSPVTIGDFAAQALLTAAVHGAFPDDLFLAEESADDLRLSQSLLDQVWQLTESKKSAFQDSSPSLSVPTSREQLLEFIDWGGKNENSRNGRTWVFDPIDGTATFLKGQQYAINCAFLIDGIEQIGIIGCPNVILDANTLQDDEIDKEGLGLMIFAVRGEGTFIRHMQSNGKLEPIAKVDLVTPQLDSLIWSDCTTYTSTIQHLHQQIAAQLDTPWPGADLYSSLMKYAALGLGRSHIVIRIFKYASWRSNMWDHAGGVLIFEEAGGRVTDLNGKSIDFTPGRKMAANYGLVCAPATVHADVLKLVQDVLKTYEETEGPIPWSK